MSYYVVDAEMGLPWDVVDDQAPSGADGRRLVRTVARCPTRDAAEAAHRLLSGECAWGIAKEEPEPTRGGYCCRRPHCTHPEFYANGLADGAAQEREKIVKWLRARHRWEVLSDLADRIERGEAGE